MIYRDGTVAALGHNYVIAVRQLSGNVMLAADPSRSTFSIEFPVAALSVDEPQLRAAQAAEFQSPIDAASIAGTRAHMLGALLLDALHFPTIALRSQQVRSQPDGRLLATPRMQVRDQPAQVEVPIRLQQAGDELIASGEFDLSHAQLGLRPYSVALGAQRVADRMHMSYRLVAQRVADPAATSIGGLHH